VDALSPHLIRKHGTSNVPVTVRMPCPRLFSPVILWNARHEWASFAFQTAGRLAQTPHFSLHRLLAAALIAVVLYSLYTTLTSRTS